MLLNLKNDIDQQRATTYLGKLIDQGAKVELTKILPPRSLNQNSYLHACFGYIAQVTGFTIEEAKVHCKRKFGSFLIKVVNDEKFLESTANLDTKQMTEFIDWLIQYAAEEIGVHLMTPDEYYLHHFEIRKELEGVR